MRLPVCLAALPLVIACDPADSAPPDAAEVHPAPTAPDAERPRFQRDITVELLGVRRVGEEVFIDVGLSGLLPPLSGTKPALHVGDEIADRSRAGQGGRADRLRFTVSAGQFARMSPTDPLILRAGFITNERSTAKPKLADVAVEVAP